MEKFNASFRKSTETALVKAAWSPTNFHTLKMVWRKTQPSSAGNCNYISYTIPARRENIFLASLIALNIPKAKKRTALVIYLLLSSVCRYSHWSWKLPSLKQAQCHNGSTAKQGLSQPPQTRSYCLDSQQAPPRSSALLNFWLWQHLRATSSISELQAVLKSV